MLTMARFSLRSLFLLITLAALGLGLWTGEQRRQERLLVEAQEALAADGIGWSPAIDGQGSYSLDLYGPHLSLRAAKALVNAKRIRRLKLSPAPNNHDVEVELSKGFVSFYVVRGNAWEGDLGRYLP